MVDASKELPELVQEQTKLQLTPGDKTVRYRTLREYSDTIGMSDDWLEKTLKELLNTKGATYFDLGCGIGIALREAMLVAQTLNKSEALTAVGVDVLPANIDGDSIPSYLRKLMVIEPNIQYSDIHNFRFPSPPDLVTASSVLLWTRNPLQVIANAISQLPEGGIFGADHIARIYINDELATGVGLNTPGFEMLNRNRRFQNRDRITLQRKGATSQSSLEILEEWFGKVPILEERIDAQVRGSGFEYFYKV